VRSLILAGGGMKVGYQAGCLQVLLDELKLDFDHIDAASGGCFNAAMMASGMSGTQVADQWRTMDATAFTTLNWREFWKFPFIRSVGTDDGLRRIFRDIWQLDFAAIRSRTQPVFTFNHFDFTEKRVAVVENRDLDEDLLIASVTLLFWLPAIARGNGWVFDAVWCTDGNVGEAVRRGATEIWAIWTVSDTPELRPGPLAQYFHLVETVAGGRFKDEWAEIAEVNARIAAHGPIPGPATDLAVRLARAAVSPGAPHQPPPPGRVAIDQHLIRQEVPVHYLFNFSRDRMAAAVEMGVRDAREYARCIGMLPPHPVHALGAVAAGTPATIPSATGNSAPASATRPVSPPAQRPGRSVTFREAMRGFFMPGEGDPVRGEQRGRAAGNRLSVTLTISTNDLDRFLHQPEHLGSAEGWLTCPLLSGSRMRTLGTFALLVNERDRGITVPGRKRFLYELEFTDRHGASYRLSGEKRVFAGRGLTVWPDTTTLYVRLDTNASGSWTPYGAGVIHVLLLDFLVELTTFRAHGTRGVREFVSAIARYGAFFAGQLSDVYARKLIDYAPF